MDRTGKPITLQDIARKTGYSVNTVSHALRYKDDIASETAEKIRQAARELGYTGNQIASSLRSGRTHLLAVILGGMSNPFYGIMADTIQDAAQAAGYSLIILCSRDDPSQELKAVEQAIARRVDGIILFPSLKSEESINRLRDAHMPFVLMSRYLKEGEADSVVCDEFQGGYLATRHLIDAGCRKLAYISSSTVAFSSEKRIQGFLRACDDFDIPASNRVIRVSDAKILSSQSRAQDWQELLAGDLLELKAQGFDGLFVFCDVETWHVLRVLQNTEGLKIGDFGIVSFDHLERNIAYPVPFCSVGWDYQEMARRSIELLRMRIHLDDQPPQTVVLPVTLSCQLSCKRHTSQEE